MATKKKEISHWVAPSKKIAAIGHVLNRILLQYIESGKLKVKTHLNGFN